MALQNRCHPDGTLHAVSARGTMMGNRGGRIHDDSQRIVRRHASRRWICCVLRFKGRQRTVMGPGYTELFFHDEAVAMAAGHRPCFECRRADALRFQSLWRDAFGGTGKADEMDLALHQARLGPRGVGAAKDLPDGTFVRADGPALIWEGALRHWDWEGYTGPEPLPQETVEILTPAPIRAVLAAGYRPQVAL